MRLFPYLLAVFLASGMVTLKLYREIPLGRKIKADSSDLYKILKTPLVGSLSDTYSYMLSAYGYYKNFIPIVEVEGKRYFVSFRFLSSWVFVPFMWIFKDYFPLAYILFFTFSAMLLLALLLERLGLKPYVSIALLILVSFITFYHLPRLMLEGPTLTLLLLFLILFFKGKIGLSLIPLTLASFIRGEISILSLIFGVYAIAKTRRFFFLISFIPIIINILVNIYFGDQSNFYFWAYKAYLENYKKAEYSDEIVQKCVHEKLGFTPSEILQRTHPYLKVKTDCWKEVLKEEFELSSLVFALKQMILNSANLLFYLPSRFLTFLPKPFIVFYLLYTSLTILSLLFYIFRGSKLILLFYFSLILIYSIYNPFGLFDHSRFKLLLVPFEIVFIASLLSRYRFPSLRPLRP